jgi:glucose/arabinose dehydrogenase
MNIVRLWLAPVVVALAMQAQPMPACSPSPAPPQSPPQNPPENPPPPSIPTTTFTAGDGTRFGVQIFLTRLEVPWSLAFAPDGRLFIAERPGRVRIVQNGQLLAEPALVLSDVFAEGEAGVLGMALHPNFAQNRFVYIAYTARTGSTPVNRLVRYREVNQQLAERAVLVDNIRAATIHDGARLRFGPDGLLYMSMGDAADTSTSQNLSSLNGKILRFTDEGRTAEGNPFSSPVWSYGHRNPQGFDWASNGDLWESEHGPTGFDELNLIERGANYGWPLITGGQTRAGMVTPVLFFSPSIAPSGTSFYRGTSIGSFRDNLFVCTLAGMSLLRVRFDPADPRRVVAQERLLQGLYGRLRDVISGPDGALYVSTSNRDGRNTPVGDDDRVLRIVAVQ